MTNPTMACKTCELPGHFVLLSTSSYSKKEKQTNNYWRCEIIKKAKLFQQQQVGGDSKKTSRCVLHTSNPYSVSALPFFNHWIVVILIGGGWQQRQVVVLIQRRWWAVVIGGGGDNGGNGWWVAVVVVVKGEFRRFQI